MRNTVRKVNSQQGCDAVMTVQHSGRYQLVAVAEDILQHRHIISFRQNDTKLQ